MKSTPLILFSAQLLVASAPAQESVEPAVVLKLNGALFT